MRRISRGRLAAEKIEAVLESARQTIGVPCVAAEREYLMASGYLFGPPWRPSWPGSAFLAPLGARFAAVVAHIGVRMLL